MQQLCCVRPSRSVAPELGVALPSNCATGTQPSLVYLREMDVDQVGVIFLRKRGETVVQAIDAGLELIRHCAFVGLIGFQYAANGCCCTDVTCVR